MSSDMYIYGGIIFFCWGLSVLEKRITLRIEDVRKDVENLRQEIKENNNLN